MGEMERKGRKGQLCKQAAGQHAHLAKLCALLL